MSHVDVILGCILDKANSDGIFRYTKIIDVPTEYLAGHNLYGKESEQIVPVDVFVAANEKGIIIKYDVNFGQIIFNEIRNKVNCNYNKILENIRTDETISIDDYHEIVAEKLDEAINMDLKHYQDDLGIERRYLVAAVRDGIKGNVLEPTPNVIYGFEKKYQFDEFRTVQIPKGDKVTLDIINTMIKGLHIVKERTIYNSRDDFEADKQAI
ncbi:MAG: hypothetical protein K0B07_02080 [DPANN group archaeon]|nr:hypothetical protein [DPANN group archaeon]